MHVVQNRVEAAYAHSDLFERRWVLMEDWPRYLARATAQGLGDDLGAGFGTAATT